MTTTNEKSIMILKDLEQFADSLAIHVLDKPRLSIWMILIPIIFVFYFYQFQKFTKGRRMFTENYLISRKRTLDEAVEAVKTGKNPEINKVARLSDVPEDVRDTMASMLSILVDHFKSLLRAEGKDFESLVRVAYQTKTNYLLYINRLNQAEKKVNEALKPHLEKSIEGVNNIIDTIELQSERLRRVRAESIFA